MRGGLTSSIYQLHNYVQSQVMISEGVKIYHVYISNSVASMKCIFLTVLPHQLLREKWKYVSNNKLEDSNHKDRKKKRERGKEYNEDRQKDRT